MSRLSLYSREIKPSASWLQGQQLQEMCSPTLSKACAKASESREILWVVERWSAASIPLGHGHGSSFYGGERASALQWLHCEDPGTLELCLAVPLRSPWLYQRSAGQRRVRSLHCQVLPLGMKSCAKCHEMLVPITVSLAVAALAQPSRTTAKMPGTVHVL